VSQVLTGEPQDPGPEPPRSPATVIETLRGGDIADEIVLECLAQLEWEDVTRIASLLMIPGEDLLPLVRSMSESTSEFRREWSEVASRGRIPKGLDRSSFISLARVGLEEDTVPKTIFWAATALQAAGSTVEGYVRESYPELGKTVYGPAGDPKEGPELAKAYGTPYPAGVLAPKSGSEVQQVRMFSDPAERAKQRESRLKEIEGMLRDMKDAADRAEVPAEGMFLNTYRDLHREKVRYS
jgi:hypothetical protein